MLSLRKLIGQTGKTGASYTASPDVTTRKLAGESIRFIISVAARTVSHVLILSHKALVVLVGWNLFDVVWVAAPLIAAFVVNYHVWIKSAHEDFVKAPVRPHHGSLAVFISDSDKPVAVFVAGSGPVPTISSLGEFYFLSNSIKQWFATMINFNLGVVSWHRVSEKPTRPQKVMSALESRNLKTSWKVEDSSLCHIKANASVAESRKESI